MSDTSGKTHIPQVQPILLLTDSSSNGNIDKYHNVFDSLKSVIFFNG